ncbi:MAG TPA: PQQ-binding-like beta-propeller repeat protein [Gemmataceae bacterium]|nr:PQQ-binding-like beta-propeller repeat protein [Gemmataceae bacterium]
MSIRSLFAVVVTVCVAATAAAGDWAVHRGNATQTGVSTEKLPEKLEVRWQFATKNAVEGTVVIANGVVYAGSADKHLYAIDLKSGALKWKTQLTLMTSSPGFKDGKVYIGDNDGFFHCIDANTGKVLWSFETMGQITAAPNFDGDNVLIPSHDSTLYCLDKGGKKVWEFKIEGPIYGGVAVAEGKTFLAGCDSLMHVLDAKTGKELGSVDLKGQSGSAAAVLGDRLYVGTMSNQVLAVNLKSLRIEWEFEAPRRKQGFYGSAAVTDDLVVIGSRDDKVWAIDRKTGRRKWDYLTEHKVDGSAVVAGDRVYIGSFDRKLYVFDLAGKKLDAIELDGAVIGSPAVADGCLVIASEKGTVYCFGVK